jgi:hypothetical protein
MRVTSSASTGGATTASTWNVSVVVVFVVLMGLSTQQVDSFATFSLKNQCK